MQVQNELNEYRENLYIQYAHLARFTNHSIFDKDFQVAMGGERGNIIKRAWEREEEQKREIKVRELDLAMWQIQLLSIIAQNVYIANGGKNDINFLELTRPERQKEKVENIDIQIQLD